MKKISTSESLLHYSCEQCFYAKMFSVLNVFSYGHLSRLRKHENSSNQKRRAMYIYWPVFMKYNRGSLIVKTLGE